MLTNRTETDWAKTQSHTDTPPPVDKLLSNSANRSVRANRSRLAEAPQLGCMMNRVADLLHWASPRLADNVFYLRINSN